jgi:hypothetical protein
LRRANPGDKHASPAPQQDDDLPHAGVSGPAEILVEILRASALEVDEMLAEVGGLQVVFGILAVEDGRKSPHTDRRPAGRASAPPALARSNQQRGRTNTRCDVPWITFTTHPTNTTPPSWDAFSHGAQRQWQT